MNPIGKAQSGMWYDPTQSGHGFDIRIVKSIVAICVNLGTVPTLYDKPIWFFAQGTVGDTTLPLLLVNAELGKPQPQILTPAGSVSLDLQPDASVPGGFVIVASLTIDPPPGGFSPPPPQVKATLRLQPIFLDAPA